MKKSKSIKAKSYQDWLEPSKYKETKIFGTREWYIQLSFRQRIRQYLMNDTQAAKEFFNKIAIHGIIPHDFDELYPKELDNIFYQPSVRALSTVEIDLLHMEFALQNTPLTDKPLIFDDQAYVIVDLNASDKQVLNDFPKILSAYRNHQENKLNTNKHKKLQEGKFNTNVFATWSDNHILPYIDLKLWADLEGFSFNRAELSDIFSNFFPDAIDEEFLRKTMEPLHEILTNQEIIRKLRIHSIQQANNTN